MRDTPPSSDSAAHHRTLFSRLATSLTGRYRLERQIGEGGMAVVYLAHDERHDRSVAIKVLHEDLGATIGQDRFLAEIKTTARLQHPHILTLLDSGVVDDGLLYYVMPFVDGESLRDKLQRERQLSLEDALRITREVGDALGYAHAHGIVHRDIKPENILILGDHALVADFGIALAVQQAGGQRLTQTGLSLGTPQYMSPEQAMGDRSVDARADIYALGAVLYEMLTGEPPFTGATVQAVVAKVLGAQPEPPTTIRHTVPPHVERAVLTALAKLPADRFATMNSFVAAIESERTHASHTAPTRGNAVTAARPRARVLGPVALASFVGVTLGVLAGWISWHNRSSRASESVLRSYVLQPENEALPTGTRDFVFAPNGDLVYVGPGEASHTIQLWRKRRSELHAARIPGTAGASLPFFSPDGKWIAFRTDAGLQRIPAEGGTPTTITPEFSFAEGRGVWLSDGRIVSTNRTWIGVVHADGGAVDRLAAGAQFAGYNALDIVAAPNGKSVLVQTCPPGCPRSAIYAVNLDTKATTQLLYGARNPAFLPGGKLAWISPTGQLVASDFDSRTLTTHGPPKLLAERVSKFQVSANGDLAYWESDDEGVEVTRPVFVGRLGHESVIDSTWIGHFSGPSVSADGRRVVLSASTPNEQAVWVKDLPSGPLTKLTTDSLQHFRPTWSSDGRFIRYVERAGSAFRLMQKRADGSGEATPMPLGAHQVVDAASAPGSGWTVMRAGGSDTTSDLLGFREGVDTTVRVLRSGTGPKLGSTLSPDAKFIAYMSIVGGTAEVFVSPFPNVGDARWQISRNGALEPRWAHNGHELFFVTLRDELMVANITTAPTFAVTSVNKLLQLSGYSRDGGFHTYDLMPDDQRFLMLKQEFLPGRLVLVTGWTNEVAAAK